MRIAFPFSFSFSFSSSRQRGQVMTMAALLLPVMLALCAFVLDVGSMYANRRALQNAADAAALAGARDLQRVQLNLSGDPVTSAKTFALKNGIDLVGAACTSDGKATLVNNEQAADS